MFRKTLPLPRYLIIPKSKRWHKNFVHSGKVHHTCLHLLQTLAASVPLFALRLSRPTPAWPLFLFMSVIMGSSGHSSQEFHLHEQRCCHCVLQLLIPLKRLFCFMASDQIQPMETVAGWKEETETGVCIPLMSSLLVCYGLPSSLFSRHSSSLSSYSCWLSVTTLSS